MTFSLNEIETMGKRAARGAGLAWGLAEEAGKAAHWLTARGLPGAEELAHILTRNDGRYHDELAPVIVDGVWHAPSDCLCPLIAGAALCDRAAELAAGHQIELGPTAQPLLLAPYMAGAAKLAGVVLEISWLGCVMIMTPDGVAIDGEREALTARSVPGVRCRRVGIEIAVTPPAQANGYGVDAETWSRLSAFAQRTYAPATEASRLAGAGAGLIDSD